MLVEDLERATAESRSSEALRARELAARLRWYASKIEDKTTTPTDRALFVGIVDRIEAAAHAFNRSGVDRVALEHLVRAIGREARHRAELRSRGRLLKEPKRRSRALLEDLVLRYP